MIYSKKHTWSENSEINQIQSLILKAPGALEDQTQGWEFMHLTQELISHRVEKKAVTDPDGDWEGFLAMGLMLGSKDWPQSALRKRVVSMRNSLRVSRSREQNRRNRAHLGTEQIWNQSTSFRRQEMRLAQAEYH